MNTTSGEYIIGIISMTNTSLTHTNGYKAPTITLLSSFCIDENIHLLREKGGGGEKNIFVERGKVTILSLIFVEL